MEKENRNCSNCIWFDKCGEEFACEHYEPASLDEQMECDNEDYIADQRMRYKYYENQINNDDGGTEWQESRNLIEF